MSNEELNYFLQCSRIRSVRHKKRMQRKQFERKLIQLFFEQRNLSKQISNLGYEKLDPPVQRGWRRFFVLRKDVARSDDALFFQKLLDKINTIQYSSKKEFKVKHRKFGKKIYEERQQNLERIFPDAYTKKEFTEREKKYFYPTLEHDLYWKRLIWVYRFLEPWRFELKIEPNIIYRTKIKDFDLIKRLDEMHQYLEWNNLQTKQCRLMHGHYQDPNRYWYSDLEKYRNPFRNKRLVDILSEYEAENLADTINEKPSPDEGFFYFDYVCCIDLRCLSAQQKRSHENNKHQWQQITIHLLWQKRPAC